MPPHLAYAILGLRQGRRALFTELLHTHTHTASPPPHTHTLFSRVHKNKVLVIYLLFSFFLLGEEKRLLWKFCQGIASTACCREAPCWEEPTSSLLLPQLLLQLCLPVSSPALPNPLPFSSASAPTAGPSSKACSVLQPSCLLPEASGFCFKENVSPPIPTINVSTFVPLATNLKAIKASPFMGFLLTSSPAH